MNGKQWTCNRCRDRGEVVTILTDGSKVTRPCPECGGAERWNDRKQHAPMAQDRGDGLPANYQSEYVRNN